MDDPYDLRRFVEAQAPVFGRVLSELRDGRKRTHWMWFVFPQIKGLGRSDMAVRYAISSLDEAAAYLRHPVLGERLRECTRLVLSVEGGGADQIFGSPDNKKFQSSMTLFAQAAREDGLFLDALKKYFHGEPDPLTLERLQQSARPNP